MNLINEENGKILQNKIFKISWNKGEDALKNYTQKEGHITLNEFLKVLEQGDLVKIFPIGTEYGKVIVLYYTILNEKEDEK